MTVAIRSASSPAGGVVMPSCLEFFADAVVVVLEQQTELQPTQIMTDAGAYSDHADLHR
ncbi:hypothetical protein P0D91_03330 [Pseudomonas sp. CBSPBW29]|uniref:transposase n=1 Tax=Pseudomonas TaxID=286 RepID=UPI0021ACF188|nr:MULTISPECIES: transposase [unclassified Pseudomonas]WEL43395.1 hypothetical protein P0D91_03330 [Pseudomonas sp. CBSPBW29]WEL64460.1 hypothetical protein P0D93_30890 [Pseudomonas sp. CBSPGW29]WEL73642.1 hypothetical protein P0D94_16800 [Pseudomonas sp. CBSPCGW29]WEL74954.1 hypothetical protein P0D92_22845 [Pseudomonas sp. CBSPAW29]WEL80805.1 hypothetical protein P0D95_22960 [Pseudomonas sp. CBSPCAW29]